MRKVLLVSPHFDDAILSAGQFMADRPDTVVYTVFGGHPEDITSVTPYDEKCGFKTSYEAMEARRVEDMGATAYLNADYIHGSFKDSQYGRTLEESDERMIHRVYTSIKDILEQDDYEFMLAPIGAGHPDHLIVSEAAAKIANDKECDITVYFWEDLPVSITDPNAIDEAIRRVSEFSFREFWREELPAGPIHKKMRSLNFYKSQMGTGILDFDYVCVPERFWAGKP